MIWGTLEARVQGAELLILGGLNEGSWPEAPAPDPVAEPPDARQGGVAAARASNRAFGA